MSEIEHYVGMIMAAGYDESDLEDLVVALRARPSVEYAVLMADGPERAARPEPVEVKVVDAGAWWVVLETSFGQRVRLDRGDSLTVPTTVIS